MSVDAMETAIELIADEAKELVKAERCSIFIVDSVDEMLWTTVSDGIGKIVIALDSGIVGATYQAKAAQVVNEPYEDSRFLPSIDKKSGFVTENMLTIPIFDSKREVIGVIQLLNKENGFDEDDLQMLTFFANYISGSLELALLNSTIG